MKYWLFDGKDAQGPYEPEELKQLPGFTAQTLICPDGAGSADQWRPSQYYLIKPPPTKAEPARSSRGTAAAPKGGMGRIAEAGLADEESAPALAPRREPVPQKRRVSTGAVIAAALAMASAAAAYFYLNAHKLHPKAAPAPAPVVQAPAPAPAPAAPPSLTDQQIQDATTFVQEFKTQSPGRRLPASPADVFSPARWKAARTVGEALTMKSLLPLDAAAASVLEKRGEGFRAGDRELRKSARRWASYSEHFLRNAAPLSWDVQRSKNCPTQSAATGEPTCFEVAALLRTQRGAPQDRHAFVADLTARTLKPLDSDAWLDLDPKGLAAWAKTHISLGEPIDEEALAVQSPVYGIPLEHHRHVARHAPVIPKEAPAQKPSEQADSDLGPPTPANADNSDQSAQPAAGQDKGDQGLDYTEPGAAQAKAKQAPAASSGSDDQMLEKALLEPNAQQPAHHAASPQPAPQSSTPPGLDHAPGSAPQPQPQASSPSNGGQASANGGNKGKSAMDMSVDELKQYLNRDGGSN